VRQIVSSQLACLILISDEILSSQLILIFLLSTSCLASAPRTDCTSTIDGISTGIIAWADLCKQKGENVDNNRTESFPEVDWMQSPLRF
jgi:hypothetical protein